MRHWLSLGTWMKCINYTLCTSFILFFGGKKQRLLIAQSTRSVILCALYIVYIIRYWHLSGHLTLHAAQCKHFKCQFMQLFCPAIDENQFAQAAKRKWNGKAERQKNKSRTRQDTNNNKLAACDTKGGWGGHWQIVFKARLSTHSRYYFNSKQTYFNFNARLWRGDSNKRKKGHKTSDERNAQSNQSPRNEMQNKTKDQKQQ